MTQTLDHRQKSNSCFFVHNVCWSYMSHGWSHWRIWVLKRSMVSHRYKKELCMNRWISAEAVWATEMEGWHSSTGYTTTHVNTQLPGLPGSWNLDSFLVLGTERKKAWAHLAFRCRVGSAGNVQRLPVTTKDSGRNRVACWKISRNKLNSRWILKINSRWIILTEYRR